MILNYKDEDIENVDVLPNDNLRISMVPSIERAKKWFEKGYGIIDRMIDVQINLVNNKEDYEKNIRIPISLYNGDKDQLNEIKQLALCSFENDSRFYISLGDERENIAKEEINRWCDNIKEAYIAVYKGKIIGFLEMRILEEYNDNPFIYFAAVDKKYRMTGAAISLYCYAISQCKMKGFKSVYGCISSKNIAVMNLYAGLGAVFGNAQDILVRMRNVDERID